MPWWGFIIAFYGASHFGILMLCWITWAYDGNGFAWLNPVFIYRHIKVNWFGAIFLALLGNISIPGIAVIYWIYKLCTVGRK